MLQSYHMPDLSHLPTTQKTAVAMGVIQLDEHVFGHIGDKTLPTGDVLTLCEICGINGAKTSADLLTLRPNITLDQVQVSTQLDDNNHTITLFCLVRAQTRHNIDSQAIAGVQAALLCLWDASRASNPTITQTCLLARRDSKINVWIDLEKSPDWVIQLINPKPQMSLKDRKVCVLTLSDRAHLGLYEDKSGIIICDIMREYGALIEDYKIIPDEPEILRNHVLELIAKQNPDVIITTGGTGVAPRDITPETLLPMFDRLVPGVGEHLRDDGADFTPLSWSSRSIAGIIDQTLIITLPGSPRAVNEGLSALLPELLPHLLRIMRP